MLIEKAILFAAEAHNGQHRKGSPNMPYIAHPFSVGIILMQFGYNEQIVAAGILHDTVEDTPVTLEQIKDEFGGYIASLVSVASEPDKSLSWEERKAHTIDFIKTASIDGKTVSCADKLDNAKAIIRDFQKYGPSVWDRFKRGKDKQLWYYKSINDSLVCGLPSDKPIPDIFKAYNDIVKQLELI